MRYLILIICIAPLIIACKNTPVANSEEDEQTDTQNKEPLYPYPQYIQNQMAYVDSAYLAIERVVKINGKTTDSGYIDRQTFKLLASEFQNPDPNKTGLRSKYSENSFHDLSLKTITFSIEATDENLPLQQADILLNPENNKVKNIILKKVNQNSDGIETQQLLWVHQMNFQIASRYQPTIGEEVEKVIKVTWDKPLHGL